MMKPLKSSTRVLLMSLRYKVQPNAYLWAVVISINVHRAKRLLHEGQGAGVYNLDLADVKLDFSVVAQENSGTGDTVKYAFTSKLHGINLTDSNELSFLFN